MPSLPERCQWCGLDIPLSTGKSLHWPTDQWLEGRAWRWGTPTSTGEVWQLLSYNTIWGLRHMPEFSTTQMQNVTTFLLTSSFLHWRNFSTEKYFIMWSSSPPMSPSDTIPQAERNYIRKKGSVKANNSKKKSNPSLNAHCGARKETSRISLLLTTICFHIHCKKPIGRGIGTWIQLCNFGI